MTEKSTKLFSDELISTVRRTWNLIDADLESVGVDILLRLFKQYPSYQQLFTSFKDTPLNELESRKEFLKHASAVAESVNKAVEILDDAEKLLPLLNNVGKAHVKRNVTPEMFANIEIIILQAIKEAIPSHASEHVIKAWREMLSAAIGAIMKGAEE